MISEQNQTLTIKKKEDEAAAFDIELENRNGEEGLFKSAKTQKVYVVSDIVQDKDLMIKEQPEPEDEADKFYKQLTGDENVNAFALVDEFAPSEDATEAEVELKRKEGEEAPSFKIKVTKVDGKWLVSENQEWEMAVGDALEVTFKKVEQPEDPREKLLKARRTNAEGFNNGEKSQFQMSFAAIDVVSTDTEGNYKFIIKDAKSEFEIEVSVIISVLFTKLLIIRVLFDFSLNVKLSRLTPKEWLSLAKNTSATR